MERHSIPNEILQDIKFSEFIALRQNFVDELSFYKEEILINEKSDCGKSLLHVLSQER